MAQNIDISELVRLNKQLADMISKKEIREIFRAEHKKAGPEMQKLVRSGLPGSKKVASWQVARFGSGGGFTAVSAEKGDHEGYAKGHITNAIENGHKVTRRKHSGSHGYHKGTKTRVKGLGFYAKARSQFKQSAEQHAKNIEKAINESLNNLGR